MQTHERREYIQQILADASNMNELRDAWIRVQPDMSILRDTCTGTYKFLIAHKDWLKKEIGKNYAK
jgi:hypothetical protein